MVGLQLPSSRSFPIQRWSRSLTSGAHSALWTWLDYNSHHPGHSPSKAGPDPSPVGLVEPLGCGRTPSPMGLVFPPTQANGAQAKEEVGRLMRGLVALLEEKQAGLLGAIEECRLGRLQSLRAQLHQHRSMEENSGMVGYAQEVLKETDQPCFVQAAKQLHHRIARAVDSLQAFRPAATASFSHFQVDLSREMKLLADLTFVKGTPGVRIDLTLIWKGRHYKQTKPIIIIIIITTIITIVIVYGLDSNAHLLGTC
uniref:COS domain-containing protein n=1 Tax=Anolis carolinensis TaxID=28377 RepID=H9G4N5_ANOCA